MLAGSKLTNRLSRSTSSKKPQQHVGRLLARFQVQRLAVAPPDGRRRRGPSAARRGSRRSSRRAARSRCGRRRRRRRAAWRSRRFPSARRSARGASPAARGRRCATRWECRRSSRPRSPAKTHGDADAQLVEPLQEFRGPLRRARLAVRRVQMDRRHAQLVGHFQPHAQARVDAREHADRPTRNSHARRSALTRCGEHTDDRRK